MTGQRGGRRAAGWLCAAHLCIAAYLAAEPVRAEVIDRVLAVVGGSLITLSDVNAASQLGLVGAPAAGDPVREVLAKLIDRELQLAEVERYASSEPSPADLAVEVEKVRSRFPSAEAFEAVLAQSGLDLGQLREMLRQNLMLRAYLEQRFSAGTEGRQEIIDDWIAGLRRRADIVNLYTIGR